MVKKIGLVVAAIIGIVALTSCGVTGVPVPGGNQQGPTPTTDDSGAVGTQGASVITSPASGSTYAVGDTIQVQSTSSDTAGVVRIDLIVNGETISSDETPGGAPQLQYSLIQYWTPDQPGTYIVVVIAYREDGSAVVPASISVTIEGTDGTGPTATATYTPTTGPSPTATYTPTVGGPTVTYTPSYTPTTQPAAQVAPADANFNNPLTIPLDNTASVTDFVSYPGGDTQDRVRWDISGMNSNSSLSGGRARLILAVSCFGTGTDNVTFFTGGQTYTCGQTIVDREVTYDSRTGQVTITAVAGEGTYVQWVLTGTATRVN